MTNSRNKGQGGEREVSKILSEELGFPIKRILDQTREGGHDISIPGFAVEVKRCEQISLGKWIRQARKSVANTDLNWAVCYRHNRGNWVVVLETDIAGLCCLSREEIKAPVKLKGFSNVFITETSVTEEVIKFRKGNKC